METKQIGDWSVDFVNKKAYIRLSGYHALVTRIDGTRGVISLEMLKAMGITPGYPESFENLPFVEVFGKSKYVLR
jgi:hypothetical protein